MDSRPIGIFDSGVGGLTVLKAIRKELPNENFIYLGDTARVPYGTKSERTVIKYSLENARFLMGFNVKMVVVACNTSSSYALEILEEELSVPVIGVVKPGAQAAVKASASAKIGVIGTEATVKSASYRREILSIAPFAEVFQKACPLFVPLIEEGWIDDEITLKVAQRYLSYFKDKDIDTLVLGCTHYPLIKELIAKVLPGVKIVDSAQETARAVRSAVKPNGGRGSLRIFVSDKTDRFEKIAKMIMGKQIQIEEVRIGAC